MTNSRAFMPSRRTFLRCSLLGLLTTPALSLLGCSKTEPLLRIASNAGLMRLRSRRRRPEVPLDLPGPSFGDEGRHQRQVQDWSPLVSQVMEDREVGTRLRAQVDALPEKYRVVLQLADYEHLSMKEIGEITGLSVPAVKTRLHRARLAVREGLSDYLAGRA